jgi:hypothetical protein
MAIDVIGTTSHHSYIREGSIVIILEQNAGFGIYGDINIRPPIIIEIVRYGGDGVSRSGLQNS